MPTIACSLRLPAPVDVEDRIRELLDLDADGLVVEGPFYEFQLAKVFGMLGGDRVHAVRLFLPYPSTVSHGASCPWALGSVHSELKRDALAQGRRTIDFAADHEIPRVLVPAARIPLASGDSLVLPEGASERERGAVLKRRAEAVGPSLSSYLGTLSKLLEHADDRGVRLALALAGGPGRLPSPGELTACTDEFRGAPLDFWPDAHAVRVSQQVWLSATSATPHRDPTQGHDEPTRGPDDSTEEDEESQDPTVAEAVSILPPAVGVSVRSADDLDTAVFPVGKGLLESAAVWVWDAAENASAELCERGLEQLRSFALGPQSEPFV